MGPRLNDANSKGPGLPRPDVIERKRPNAEGVPSLSPVVVAKFAATRHPEFAVRRAGLAAANHTRCSLCGADKTFVRGWPITSGPVESACKEPDQRPDGALRHALDRADDRGHRIVQLKAICLSETSTAIGNSPSIRIKDAAGWSDDPLHLAWDRGRPSVGSVGEQQPVGLVCHAPPPGRTCTFRSRSCILQEPPCSSASTVSLARLSPITPLPGRSRRCTWPDGLRMVSTMQ